MTCGEGGPVDGLGRLLKAEATPLTPAAAEPFDPKISDPNLGEHLGIPADLENLPRGTANDTDSRVLPIVGADGLAVCCGGSKQEQQAPEAKPALKARPVSIVKRSDSMKWQTFTIWMFSVAIGCLYGINSRTNEKVDGLTAYYLQKEYSPEAMQGKTYIEVTPQVEGIGISRFIPITQQLPYTDSATLERLFNEESWVVAKVWGEGSSTVVQMSNWYTDWNALWPSTEMAGLDEHRALRSVLIHPNPASAKVYKDMADEWRGSICSSDFKDPEHYAVENNGAMRVVDYALTTPAITHKELARLGDMYLMREYGNGVALLIGPYGTSERFVRFSDEDFGIVQTRWWRDINGCGPHALKEVNWGWWQEVSASAIKEEQTAVK